MRIIDWDDIAKKTLDAEKLELMKEANLETAMKEFLVNEGFEQSLVETLVNNTLEKTTIILQIMVVLILLDNLYKNNDIFNIIR